MDLNKNNKPSLDKSSSCTTRVKSGAKDSPSTKTKKKASNSSRVAFKSLSPDVAASGGTAFSPSKASIPPQGAKMRPKRGAALSQRLAARTQDPALLGKSLSKSKKVAAPRGHAEHLDGTAAGAIQISIPAVRGPAAGPQALKDLTNLGKTLEKDALTPVESRGTLDEDPQNPALGAQDGVASLSHPSAGPQHSRAGASASPSHDPKDGGLWGVEGTSSLSGQISALLGASAFSNVDFGHGSDGFFAGNSSESESTEASQVAVSAAGNPLYTSTGQKIKALPPSVVKDIEQKNIARRLAGLSVITIKVRRCIACGSPFESAGNRTCGCSNRAAGSIAGREII